MAKWKWQRRAYTIQDFVNLLSEQEDKPRAEDLTLEWTCFKLKLDLLPMLEGQGEDDPNSKYQANQIRKFLADFEQSLREPIPNAEDTSACSTYEKKWEKDPDTIAAKAEEQGRDNDLLCEAVEIIFSQGNASYNYLQKKLKLGYASTADLMDKLASLGVIGPYAGSAPRALLLTEEQWAQKKKRLYP